MLAGRLDGKRNQEEADQDDHDRGAGGHAQAALDRQVAADRQAKPAAGRASPQASASMVAIRSVSSRAVAAGTMIRAITSTVPTALTEATTTRASSMFEARSSRVTR
jgi:hypothetical protein